MSLGGFAKKLFSGHPIEAIKELLPKEEIHYFPPPEPPIEKPIPPPKEPPIEPPREPPPKEKLPPDDRRELIQRVQSLKREYAEMGQHSLNRMGSDRYVRTNPVTGAPVPTADLRYAATHLAQIYESGAIREVRWAFLWYH